MLNFLKKSKVLPQEHLDSLKEHINQGILAGFLRHDEILSQALDCAVEDGANRAQCAPVADQIFKDALLAFYADQATWPATTDCDRLDAAFASLESSGVVCRQNFTCCGTCGSSEIWDEMAPGSLSTKITGYAFFHMQDTERAVEGDGLYLNYGATQEGEGAALIVGHQILQRLHEAGLAATWDGSVKTRIFVPMDWKRRSPKITGQGS